MCSEHSIKNEAEMVHFFCASLYSDVMTIAIEYTIHVYIVHE